MSVHVVDGASGGRDAGATTGVHLLTRRLVALVLDVVLLGLGLLATLALGVSVMEPGIVEWLVLAWVALVAPLYFALYHAYGGPERGPGWTPGQREVGIAVQDARTGGRLPVGRALARAYGGLAATVLVVPLLADVVSLFASGEARAWHDRVTGSEVARAREVESGTSAVPTDASVVEVFEPSAEPSRAVMPRARRLLSADRRALLGSTLLLYLLLLGVAGVLVPLVVSDWSGGPDEIWAWAEWLVYAVLLFTSGVYWAQATLACAVDAVRTGEPGVTLVEIVRRAARRANALCVAVVLLVVLLALSPWTLFVPLFVVARLSLVVPAIVLEERTLLGAIGRSWTLTRARTFSILGRMIVSIVALGTAIWIVIFVGISLVWAVAPDDLGVSTAGVAVLVALAVAAVPLSALVALVGTGWCVLFYDLRRTSAADEAR